MQAYASHAKACSYCEVVDHTVEECPQLIAKWHANNLGNPIPLENPNQNIQMIYVDPREENIVVVIRGGDASVADQNAQHDQPQVRSEAENKVSLNVQKEKELFLDS